MKGEINMRKGNFLKITTYAAVFGIIGGMSFEGVTYLSDKLTNTTAVESVSDMEKTNGDSSTDNNGSQETGSKDTITPVQVSANSGGVSDVVDEVLPSIVAIDVTATQTGTDFFGRTYQQDATGSGSGIIIDKDQDYLYIATNNHVVTDTDANTGGVSYASTISVKFYDDKVYNAEVKGTDSSADLAVVAIKLSDIQEETLNKIKVAKLGNSDDIKVGEQAIAIGNALGYGTSVTVGYISAKDREVQGEDVNMKLIQTDAAINPGNSGGALVDAGGNVIGINSAKYADTSVEGMGFAIPVNTAIPIIESIVKAEAVPEDQAAYLGIKGEEVPSEYAQHFGIPEGICVREVTEDAPASKAGVKAGDIIVKFNGMDVKTMENLQEKLALCKAGDKVKVVVKRADNGDYIEKTLDVTLGKKSDSEAANSNNNSNSGNNGSNSSNNNYPQSGQSYGSIFNNFYR